jgi:3-phosphoglycerate kinase
MTNFHSLDDLDVTGKRVLLRADFNVPMKDGKVSDLTRIERGAASIRELSRRGAKVVVLSHFGRPNGKPVPEMSLKPIAAALSQVLGGQPVAFADRCIGQDARTVIAGLARATSLCWRICASMERRRRTIPASPGLWRLWATSM